MEQQMKPKIVRLSLLVFACLLQFVYAGAQGTPDAWYGRQAKPKDFDPPMTFAGTFAIQLPKDWQLAPGHTGTIFLSVEKNRKSAGGALVALEYMRLQAPLDPALIPGASEVELQDVQAREMSGKGFSREVKQGGPGQIIVIHYTRPGVSGGDVHVVQYSIPVGTTMYRLICIAPATEIEKYRPLFAHVAASFTPINARGM
jgi:hypothetical protein